MNIRETSPSDLKAINDLLAICYPKLMKDAYHPDILDRALPFLTKARPELLSSGTYFVATSPTGEIIGCGGWTLNSPQNETKTDTGHIRHFATHPKHTNIGVARSIFEVCKDQVSQYSIKKFECYSSLNAEGFYKSLGFVTLEKLELPFSEDLSFPCVLMEYTL